MCVYLVDAAEATGTDRPT